MPAEDTSAVNQNSSPHLQAPAVPQESGWWSPFSKGIRSPHTQPTQPTQRLEKANMQMTADRVPQAPNGQPSRYVMPYFDVADLVFYCPPVNALMSWGTVPAIAIDLYIS